MKKHPKKDWGFDATGIDISVRPQDDFYQYANGTWVKKTKLPNDEARWGSFVTLRHDTEYQLKTILDDLLKRRTYPRGSQKQLVGDYYRSVVDLKRRNALGIKALHDMRLKIEKMSSQKELLETIVYLQRAGASAVWNYFVDQDSKNSSRYLLHLWQGGLGLPERDYYLLDKPEQKRVREAYTVHIEKLLAIAGFAAQNITPAREIIMKIETRLAKASMKKEDTRDPHKTYHKVAPSAFWKTYLTLLGAKKVKELIVGQPAFFAEVQKMLRAVPLDEWKIYLKWHVINDFAGALSEPFVQENFNFYVTTMTGTKVMKPLWRRALSSTNGALSDALGKLYVEKYFPESSKRKIDQLVSDLFEVYEQRMKRLDWMSAGTKRKAIAKLHAVNRKIGYPKKWDLYKDVVIRADDYLGNILRIRVHDHKKSMRKLNHGVDRGEWFMSPQMVNAYCSQTLNDIVFPAAILQWPFFDPEADDAVNYGAIGSVIGHEMTHIFDDNGAKFDIKGNLKNWWTPTDKKRFERKGKLIITQANQYVVLPGINLNGILTLGENIADLGGMIIAYDAYQKHMEKTGRNIVGGLSPEMRFFLSYAQIEREVVRPEYTKMSVLTDPHPPGPFRINAPLSHFDAFYQTFNIKKGDRLYRDPKLRAHIW